MMRYDPTYDHRGDAIQAEFETSGPEDVFVYDIIDDSDLKQLIFGFESVLTEMRTHGKSDQVIREWVRRLDQFRDEYVNSSRGSNNAI